MPTTVKGLVCYVLAAPLLLATFFTVAAACGCVTSDPAGKHPITVGQIWSLR